MTPQNHNILVKKNLFLLYFLMRLMRIYAGICGNRCASANIGTWPSLVKMVWTWQLQQSINMVMNVVDVCDFDQGHSSSFWWWQWQRPTSQKSPSAGSVPYPTRVTAWFTTWGGELDNHRHFDGRDLYGHHDQQNHKHNHQDHPHRHHVAVVVATVKDTTVVGAPVRGSHRSRERTWAMSISNVQLVS